MNINKVSRFLVLLIALMMLMSMTVFAVTDINITSDNKSEFEYLFFASFLFCFSIKSLTNLSSIIIGFSFLLCRHLNAQVFTAVLMKIELRANTALSVQVKTKSQPLQGQHCYDFNKTEVNAINETLQFFHSRTSH